MTLYERLDADRAARRKAREREANLHKLDAALAWLSGRPEDYQRHIEAARTMEGQ